MQYNKDNRAFEVGHLNSLTWLVFCHDNVTSVRVIGIGHFFLQGAKGTNITVDTLCGIMQNTAVGSPTQRYAKVNSLILDTYGQKCLSFDYYSMIKDLSQIDWTSSAGEGGLQILFTQI